MFGFTPALLEESPPVSVDGASIASWIRRGTGASWIVFIHGAGVDHRTFNQQIEAFDAETSLLLYDLRGNGRSRLDRGHRARFDDLVTDLLILFDHYRIDEATIIAHSFGGNVAQEFALLHPGRVRNMVLVGCWGIHRARTRQEALRMRVAGPLYRRMPWQRLAEMSAAWCSDIPESRDYVRDCLLSTDRDVYLDLGEGAWQRTRPIAGYPQPKPTLLVRGEHDNPATLDRIFAAYCDLNPLSRVSIIPATKHQPMQDNPASFNQAVTAFLADETGESGVPAVPAV